MVPLLLAVAFGCGDLCAEGAQVHYRDLLALSGYGRFEIERAGFLIRERDGSITFAPWDSVDIRRAKYRGSIPAGTIAVVHTHPSSSPDLSAHDRHEARRIGLPVVVVSTAGVVAAMPDGSEIRVRPRR